MFFSGCSPHKDSEGPCIAGRLTPTAYVIGWGGRCFKPRFLSLFFLTGGWVWSDGFPLERLSWVCFCLLFFLALSFCSFFLSCCSLLVFSFRRWCLSLCLSPLVGDVRFFSLCVCRALASCWCLCRGGVSHGVGGYVCCGVCVFSSASPCNKENREVLPCACNACFFFSLSRPLASCPHVVLVVLVCF